MNNLPGYARLIFLPLAFLAVFIVYGKSLDGGFVYDDHYFVETNPAIRSLRNAPAFFSDPGTRSTVPGLNSDVYRPLATLSYAADYAVAGLNPGYFRAVNILLHCVNSLLVFYLVTLLGFSAAYAVFAGAFFALFPASVESVAWVASRSTVLSTALILCSVIFFMHYAAGGGRRRLLLSVLAAAAALFTRETAVVIPLLAVPYLLIFKPPSKKQLWTAGLWLGAPAALFVALRFVMLGRLQQVPQPDLPLGSLIALPFLVFAKYLDVLVYPFQMLITYSDIITMRLDSVWFYLPFSLIVFLLYCGLIWALLRRGEKAAAWGLLWAAIALLPVLNIVSMTFYMAERLLYLPLAGAALAAAAAARWFSEKYRSPALLWTACAALLLAFAVNIQARLPVWHDDVSLWSYDTQKNPWNFLTRMRLADALRARGDNTAAAAALHEALIRASNSRQRAMAYNEMGALMAMSGNIKKASMFFLTSLTLNPDNHVALYNLGKACAIQGEAAAARRYLASSLAINGGYAPARALAVTLAAQASSPK